MLWKIEIIVEAPREQIEQLFECAKETFTANQPNNISLLRSELDEVAQ